MNTKRPISEGAEKWLDQPIKCLDHGFVYLVDYSGNDTSIEQAARVSYSGGGTRKQSETEGLIRYLRRHAHTTPFEMIELKFHAKMPIFVARQWVRHRTASINEESARYSILSNEFYIPEPEALANQSKNNKQGRGEVLSKKDATAVRKLLLKEGKNQYKLYQCLLNDDGTGSCVSSKQPMVARELSRAVLGTQFYTQWYWKTDLHNFMNFARLRMDPHAQYEIRVYANAMAKIVKESFPIAWKAFEDYELMAKKFTAPELNIISTLLKKKKILFSSEEIEATAIETGLTNRREKEEALEKFKGLGLV